MLLGKELTRGGEHNMMYIKKVKELKFSSSEKQWVLLKIFLYNVADMIFTYIIMIF